MLLFFISDFALFVILAFFLAVFFVLAFGVIAAIVFYKKRKQNRDGKIWAKTAAQLGLNIRPVNFQMLSDLDKIRHQVGANVTVNPETVTTAQSLYGNYYGRPVEVVIRQRRVSSDVDVHGLERRYYTTCCEAAFENPGNIDFQIISRNYGNFISRALDGGSEIKIGFSQFDENFIVRGGDLRQIHALLCAKSGDNRAVAESFAAHLNGNWIIETSGEKIVVKFSGMVLDAANISHALGAATELAMRVESALAK
jgi:hypothetical protein